MAVSNYGGGAWGVIRAVPAPVGVVVVDANVYKILSQVMAMRCLVHGEVGITCCAVCHHT